VFVGHYAASLALKKFEKRASLGVLFLAVQFVDIVFFPFVLLGIERINIIENYTPSTHFQLEYMPFTHSLLASFLWASIAYAFFRWVVVKIRSVALVMAIAVFSHWVIDLVVHTPDLPLWSDASMKLGLGLWNNAIVTYAVEAALLLGALLLYMKSTTATTRAGKYGMVIFQQGGDVDIRTLGLLPVCGDRILAGQEKSLRKSGRSCWRNDREPDPKLRARFCVDQVDSAIHCQRKLVHDGQTDTRTDGFSRQFGF
jgi:hypothetical protein